MVGERWGKFAIGVLALVAALATLVPSAGAEGEPDTGAFNAFTLKASNGYKMFVFAGSKRGYRDGEALILVNRRGRSVSYLAPATVTDTRIHAELGALGRIDLEFAPSGSKRTVRSQCDPDTTLTYDEGSYVGSVEFRGEEGYTEVTAARVPFWPRFFVDLGCFSVGYGELLGPGLPGARLTAYKRLEDRRLALQVNQNRPGARVWLTAEIEERQGPIRISRQIETIDPSGSFSFDPQLRSAVLGPQDPFSGSVVFRRRAPRGDRWTGNLEIDFPGRSDVSLSGPGFQTALRHARFTKGVVRTSGSDSAIAKTERNRPNLFTWPSTNPSPTASAIFSRLAPS